MNTSPNLFELIEIKTLIYMSVLFLLKSLFLINHSRSPMKKKILTIFSTILIFLSIQTAFAASSEDIELGRGFFYVGDTTPVSINLDKLTANHTYDVVCVVKALDANNFHAKLSFNINDQGGVASFEKTFTDEHERAIFFTHYTMYQPNQATLTNKV